MPQVRIAPAALYLRASHAVAGIGFCLDGGLIRWGVKAGPSRSRVVFGIRTKQRAAATHAFVYARSVGILVLPRERRLRSLLSGHIVLIRCELFFPIVFVLTDFLVHGSPLG